MADKKTEKTEKWVINKTVHLGGARDSFSPGTIIEHYPSEHALVIDGKRYESDKDLFALMNLEKKTGQRWIVPFSAQAVSDAKKVPSALAKDKPPMKDEGHKTMPVIRSDSDERGEIDISSTKNRPINRDDKSKKMEVIRGDEIAEERVARLQREIPKMEVIRDDSLGEVSGPSLNNGEIRSAKPNTVRMGPKAIVVASTEVEGLPGDVEVAKMPSFSQTEPVKRGPGRPRKAKQVPGGV